MQRWWGWQRLPNQEEARDEASYRQLAEVQTAAGMTTQHLSGNLENSQTPSITLRQKYCMAKPVSHFTWIFCSQRTGQGQMWQQKAAWAAATMKLLS